MDSLTTIKSLDPYIEKLLVTEGKLEVHLYGGDESSKKYTLDLVKYLKGKEVEIISSDLINNSFEPKSLAIDAKTGEIFTCFKPKQLSLDKDYKNKMTLLEMQMNESKVNLTYDGISTVNKIELN